MTEFEIALVAAVEKLTEAIEASIYPDSGTIVACAEAAADRVAEAIRDGLGGIAHALRQASGSAR
jgi:hypothetical protein